MRVGIVATRLAGVDGVTFEAAKWEMALERMGHEVRLCAGEVDGAITDDAVTAVRQALAHPERQRRIARRNFDIARRRLSYRVLRRRLRRLLGEVVGGVTG